VQGFAARLVAAWWPDSVGVDVWELPLADFTPRVFTLGTKLTPKRYSPWFGTSTNTEQSMAPGRSTAKIITHSKRT
jgi:hypothetical protein